MSPNNDIDLSKHICQYKIVALYGYTANLLTELHNWSHTMQPTILSV